MAKVKGLIRLHGTIDGINYYERKGVALARKAGGGFNGEAIRTKDSMVRVRENGSEFRDCMKAVQFFKQGLSPILSLIKDGTLHQRLVSLFTQIKLTDVVYARGFRSVGIGLHCEFGKALLQGYVLTGGKSLNQLLRQRFVFDWETGLTLPDFDGGLIAFTGSSSLLELRVGYLTLDFETLSYQLEQSAVVYLDKSSVGTLSLGVPVVPAGGGTRVGVVFARFVQEVNGVYYPVQGKQEVVLEVVYVG